MKNSSNEWMSISDMMSGLMLVFLFISISFMVEVKSDNDKMREVASSYRDSKADLNEELYGEFEDDLKKWDASISKDNTISFNSPDVLFGVNESEASIGFRAVLDEFFPRYLKILSSKKYKETIKEIRVEGHTSNEWRKDSSPKEIYLKNMQLSQERAYSVLSYCYSIDSDIVLENRAWLESNFRANGMAYAKLKDKESSRRVEFTIFMKSEDKIYKILKKSR